MTDGPKDGKIRNAPSLLMSLQMLNPVVSQFVQYPRHIKNERESVCTRYF